MKVATKERELLKPAGYSGVYPYQVCPSFVGRSSAPAGVRECQHCVFSEFKEELLRQEGVGVCYWPLTMNE